MMAGEDYTAAGQVSQGFKRGIFTAVPIVFYLLSAIISCKPLSPVVVTLR